jgi:FkbM family methyltransferase
MDSFRNRLSHAGARLRQITAFGRAGLGTRDKFKMAVAGYARGHTFSGAGLISKLGRTIFPEIVVKPSLLCGKRLHINPSNLSHLVALEEVLLSCIYPFDQLPFEPDVVMDCGANIGLFTLLALSRFPNSRLIAFEPDPENIESLRKHVTVNHLKIEFVEAAVSTEDGQANFEAGLGVGSALTDGRPTAGRIIHVRTVKLARLIAEAASKKLLLKLDVEGAEDRLFPDIIDHLPATCSVFFETHGGEKSWAQASRLLERAAFSVSVVRRRSVYVEAHAVRVSEEMPN